MFDNDIKVELYPSRAAAARELASRCVVPSATNKDLWHHAWNNFQTDSFGQIPPLKCIRLSDPNAAKKLELRRLRYRQLAVLHLLPKFKEKLPLLTGKAAKNVRGIINMLRFWEQTLPPRALIKLPKKPKIPLGRPSPAPQILLPLPPTIKKNRLVQIQPSTDQVPLPESACSPVHRHAAGALRVPDSESSGDEVAQQEEFLSI